MTFVFQFFSANRFAAQRMPVKKSFGEDLILTLEKFRNFKFQFLTFRHSSRIVESKVTGQHQKNKTKKESRKLNNFVVVAISRTRDSQNGKSIIIDRTLCSFGKCFRCKNNMEGFVYSFSLLQLRVFRANVNQTTSLTAQ